MLVATGILLGFVLLVMVGESVQEMQLAGWLPTTSIGVHFPGFVGLWFATFPTVEGLVAQVGAAGLVIGSYFVAERARQPARRSLELAGDSA
jgi:high-affinity iron transporter